MPSVNGPGSARRPRQGSQHAVSAFSSGPGSVEARSADVPVAAAQRSPGHRPSRPDCYAYRPPGPKEPNPVGSDMSYVRNCESDVFISYAHFDNEPMFEGERGWVEVFHQALQVRLRQLLGENPDVWRDPSLAGNDYLQDTLRSKLLRTALLLSIVTPRYLKSESCLSEIDEFCRGAEQSGGIRLQDKARLMKVVKTEVPREELPPALQPLLGYKFYSLDPENRPR